MEWQRGDSNVMMQEACADIEEKVLQQSAKSEKVVGHGVSSAQVGQVQACGLRN